MRICLPLMVFVILGCNNPYDHKIIQPNVQNKKTQSVVARPIEHDLRELVANAHHIRDILHFEKVIQFPDTNQHHVGSISSVFRLGSCFYFLDEYGQQIFQADLSGNIIRTIGSIGQGPGEFENPSAVIPVWREHVGVINQGKIDVFDSSGQFLNEFSVTVGRHIFHARRNVIWDDPTTIYIADFPSQTLDMPAHGIFKFDGNSFSHHASFADRIWSKKPFSKYNQWGTLAFSLVENTVWTSSPYKSSYEIYDENGQLLKTHSIQHPDVVEFSDFSTVKSEKDMAQLFMSSSRALTIQQVGPLVFAFYVAPDQTLCDVFDTAGNLLKANLDTYRLFLAPIAGGNSELLMKVEYPNKMETWSKYLDDYELTYLNEQGINTTEPSQGAPFLISMTLKVKALESKTHQIPHL